jgi:hypothetical protein
MKLAPSQTTEAVLMAQGRINELVDLIDYESLIELIKANPSFRGMVTGYIGEYLLENNVLRKIPGVTHIRKPPDSDKKDHSTDRMFYYNDRKYSIQCKSLRTSGIKEINKKGDHYLKGTVYVSATSRAPRILPDGRAITTKYALRGSFDILAASLFLFNGDPESFAFMDANKCRVPNGRSTLTTEEQSFFLHTNEPLTWPLKGHWTTNLTDLLDDKLGTPINEQLKLEYDNITTEASNAEHIGVSEIDPAVQGEKVFFEWVQTIGNDLRHRCVDDNSEVLQTDRQIGFDWSNSNI